ncbi:AAA domain-containing protein [Mucilaginibacter sp. HD30]
MKIKDMRQFRQLIKKDIAEMDIPSRNEHFIGVSHEVREGEFEYGFFNIYHGLKDGYQDNDGVRGFLQGFLDMAKDGQAVYEFMQNAVDALSTRFGLFWGKDELDGNSYLLVANNGNMFDADAVQSILNIGVSTKAADNYTIGKFGIGFKLAHRLVGKENGLDELLNNNYGPILFSWQQAEPLLFTVQPEVEPTSQQYQVYIENKKKKAKVLGTEPWLFKILITNFPCQPENDTVPELIRDYRYQETGNSFSRDELAVMGRWIQKYRSYFETDFEHGSLFFLKLGQGKQGSLEEVNLEEGVRFSMTILNRTAQLTLGHSGLKEVNLNQTLLKPIDLDFEPFIFEKGSADFHFIRFGKEEINDGESSEIRKDADIEILMGFTDHEASVETFKNAPNFYLFFPLSEEKHRLCFILHSNAFYKSSSRTYLQKGNAGTEGVGINERLFSRFAARLTQRMKLWSESTDEALRARFLKVYATLLLSDKSDNPERVWVNEPLWEPLFQLICNQVPVRSFDEHGFTIAGDHKNVRMKGTALPVDTLNWLGGHIHWFYWDDEQAQSLAFMARQKLLLKQVTILDILDEAGSAEHINRWLLAEPAGIKLIFEELEAAIALVSEEKNIRANIAKLAIWPFSNGQTLSLAAAEEDERYLILFNRIDDLGPYLLKAGFYTTDFSLSDYPNLFKYIQTTARLVQYFNSFDELVTLLNPRFAAAGFAPGEKRAIFEATLKIGSRSPEERVARFRRLTLFSNTNGQILALSSMIKAAEHTWLKGWCIAGQEYFKELDDYLCRETEVYAQIIQPAFTAILTQPGLRPADIPAIYTAVKQIYARTPLAPGLAEITVVYTPEGLLPAGEAYYYCAELAQLTEGQYSAFSSLAPELGIASLPLYGLLPFYEAAPFKLSAGELELNVEKPLTEVSIAAATGLLKLCASENREVFDQLTIGEAGGALMIYPETTGVSQALTQDKAVQAYLQVHHQAAFRLLPVVLHSFGELVDLKKDELIEELAERCTLTDDEQLSALLALVSQAGGETRKKVLEGVPLQLFDLDQPLRADSAPLRFLTLVLQTFTVSAERIALIREKIAARWENETLYWKDAQFTGNDAVTLLRGETEYQLSLSQIILNDQSRATRVAGLLVERLTEAAVAERSVLTECLGLEASTDHEYIYDHLTENYQDRPLERPDQLAFLLLSVYEPGDFIVETCAGPHEIAGGVFYLPENTCPVLSPELQLAPCYAGLAQQLKMKPGDHFSPDGKIQVLHSPYLKGERLTAPGADHIPAAGQAVFFDFCYALFQAAPEAPVKLSAVQGWAPLIGFEPAETVADPDWAYAGEALAPAIGQWLETAGVPGQKFLSALGVSFSDSPIVALRSFLAGAGEQPAAATGEQTVALLLRTVLFLHRREVTFSLPDPRRELLTKLIAGLSSRETALTELPLLAFSGLPGQLRLTLAKPIYWLSDAQLEGLAAIGFDPSDLAVALSREIALQSCFDASWCTSYPGEIETVGLSAGNIDEQVPQKEWERAFYQDWKKSYPELTVIGYEQPIPRTLKANGQIVYRYGLGDAEVLDAHTALVNVAQPDRTVVTQLQSLGLFPNAAMEALLRLFEKYDEQLQDYLQRIQSNPGFKQEWELLKRKLEQEAERKKMKDEFLAAERYSLDWFLKLIEIMLLSSPANKNAQGSVSFRKAELNPADHRILVLISPTENLSPSLEYFSDYRVLLHYIDPQGAAQVSELPVKAVMKEGQRVYVLPAEPADLTDIPLVDVFQAVISFSRPSGLSQQLYRCFHRLDLPPEYNVAREMTDHVRFIFGPPGTGKTTNIAEKILERMRVAPHARILVLTPTNKAANVIVKRILKQSLPSDLTLSWLVRYGNAPDTEIIDHNLARDAGNFDLDRAGGQVLVTTVHRFFYDQVRSHPGRHDEETIALADVDWQTIIFDEASMIMLPAIVYPMLHRRYRASDPAQSTEFIIGGDPLQIPPIFDIPDQNLPEEQRDVKEENIYSMVSLRSFLEADQQIQMPRYAGQVENLKTQYRSVAAIGKLFSRFSYKDLLLHGRALGLNPHKTAHSRPLPSFFAQLGFKPLTIIRYPTTGDHPIYYPRTLNESPVHVYSALLVNELLLRFKKDTQAEPWKIGVVTPYRAQADLINAMAEDHRVGPADDLVTIDTVHGFQGDESELVFAVFNPSTYGAAYSRFFKKQFIINVAISRAEDYLVLLLPEDLQGASLLDARARNSVMDLVSRLEEQDQVAILKASDVEAQLMGKAKFFEGSSITDQHQQVNVYGKPGARYAIRWNEQAIDIHWA